MLDLHNILWVVPGVIFISIYNRKRPGRAVNLSGWQYIFALVFIASLTWFPAEFVAAEVFQWLKTLEPVKALFNWLNVEMSPVEQDKVKLAQTLLTAIGFAFVLLLLVQWGVIAKMVFPPVYDNFYNRCVEWENRFVLVTLTNGKAYHGILWKYPENPKSKYESQTISIIPFKSGYRDNQTKQVIWSTYYPEYRDELHLINTELIIPRSEIVTFGKFSRKTFEHFEKQHFLKDT